MHITKKLAILTLSIGLSCVAVEAKSAQATILTYNFDASLDSGPLSRTEFSGSFSFDNSGSTGTGKEFFSLKTLDFNLLGTTFTRADIRQGGQAILNNGNLEYFTAAFFPPPPANSPVSDIAFGFGGPGIIGYTIPSGLTNFGEGSYTIRTQTVPEPSALYGSIAALGVGLLMKRKLKAFRAG